ncbi:hypothetical protein [Candidatus Uabimicrobium amorphum]|uniref:Uncharacterized protein n=1 Tax=Uabimicrobium amorphum TaxID=2596890 RepID=A0A5S9F5Q1_UABAM|nr:hypothetical protein [Candidatus Uabimicrobium amorphum]BBM86858.1 hypothetical protein UABAM_05258 [Candidatus Uabimicrobium amorphum]
MELQEFCQICQEKQALHWNKPRYWCKCNVQMCRACTTKRQYHKMVSCGKGGSREITLVKCFCPKCGNLLEAETPGVSCALVSAVTILYGLLVWLT